MENLGSGSGHRRKWGGGSRLAAARGGEGASLLGRRVHEVGVRRFHSNFGGLASCVSEGVTNQSPGTGINYVNHYLAMGQMTPILKKLPLAELAV